MGIQNTKTFRLAVLAGIVAAINWAEPHVAIVTSPSIKYSLLWRVSGPIVKGDYIDVPLPDPFRRWWRSKWMAKRVGCVGGEVLKMAHGGHYCNDVWLGAVSPSASDGQPLVPFVWNGPVPSGKVYLVGDDPRSYDSRYLGFFDLKDAIRLKGLF